MSSSPTRPSNFKNLSPFAGGKKAKDNAGQAFLLVGAIGILAAIAIIVRAFMLK